MHEGWPAIPYGDWAPTCEVLHRFLQILGKYRLAHTPWVNHSWHRSVSSCCHTRLSASPMTRGAL
jgi:hypothetical protein